MKTNAVPPEVDNLEGFGRDKDQDYLSLSAHLSRLSNQVIVTLSALDSFPFEEFKMLGIHTGNLARGVSTLPYTNRILGELLVGYAASLISNSIKFSSAVANVLRQNPMDLSLAVSRKGKENYCRFT